MRVARPVDRPIPEADAPQAVDGDRAMVGSLQQAARLPAVSREPVAGDPPVAEVPDEQVPAESAEHRPTRSPRETPGGVQLAARRDAGHERAVGTERADVAQPRAGDLVLGVGVLLGVGDVDHAVEVLDTERREPLRDPRIVERSRESRRVEVLVEDVDSRVVEVGGVQVVGAARAPDGQALVDRTGRRRPLDGVGVSHRRDVGVPAENCALLGREDEPRGP